MKETLKKLSNSTAAKILAATIVPGGFLMWGAYEFGRFIESRAEAKNNERNDEQSIRGEQGAPYNGDISNESDGNNDETKSRKRTLPDSIAQSIEEIHAEYFPEEKE